MKSQLIPIPTDMLLTVLDIVKGVKSEYVSIPRMITKVPIMSNMVCGTSDNAICHIASLSNLYEINGLINIPLWEEPRLTNIVMMSKEINPFIKIITDYTNAKAIRDNKLSSSIKKIDPVLFKKALPLFSYLVYDEVEVNNTRVCIGRQLYMLDENNNILESVAGNNTITRSMIQLYPPHIVLDPVKKYQIAWNFSFNVCRYIDISSDEAFLDILSLKASEGAKIWCPDVVKYGDKLKPYIFYMNKTILNNVKGDKIYLSIHDHIPNMDSRYFMVQLSIEKTKKSARSLYEIYMMCLKIA